MHWKTYVNDHNGNIYYWSNLKGADNSDLHFGVFVRINGIWIGDTFFSFFNEATENMIRLWMRFRAMRPRSKSVRLTVSVQKVRGRTTRMLPTRWSETVSSSSTAG